MKVNRIAAAVFGMQMLIGLAAVPALAAGKRQTLTGEVSDAMCGAKHEMPGKAADCTRGCINMDRNTRSWSVTKFTPWRPRIRPRSTS